MDEIKVVQLTQHRNEWRTLADMVIGEDDRLVEYSAVWSR